MKQFLVLNKRKEKCPRELSGIQAVAWMLTPLNCEPVYLKGRSDNRNPAITLKYHAPPC
jgi:hypothetical protein